MAVPVQTPFVEYIANGVTTNFPLGFDCETQSHLIVTVDDIEPITGSWSLLVGAVVFNSAPITGSKIIIKRNSPFERDRDFQLYDQSFRPPAVNLDLDRIWRKLQELGVMDWILGNRIDDLKNYVDDRDDELRAYLLEEIRKQGVALDQLEDYYNYLMQRLAEIAVNGGWESSFVSYGSINQKKYNDGVESIAELLAISNPQDGMRMHVNSYNPPNYALFKPYDGGGGDFVYKSSKTGVNDDGLIINGWVRQNYSVLKPEFWGADPHNQVDCSAAFNKCFAAAKGRSIELDGHYKFTSPIVVDYADTGTLKMYGQGSGMHNGQNGIQRTVLNFDGLPTGSIALTFKRIRGLKLSDFHITHSTSFDDSSTTCWITTLDDFEIERVTLKNTNGASSTGFRFGLTDGTDCAFMGTVKNCEINMLRGRATAILPACTSINHINCYQQGGYFYSYKSQYCKYDNCASEGSPNFGYIAEDTKSLTYISCAGEANALGVFTVKRGCSNIEYISPYGAANKGVYGVLLFIDGSVGYNANIRVSNPVSISNPNAQFDIYSDGANGILEVSNVYKPNLSKNIGGSAAWKQNCLIMTGDNVIDDTFTVTLNNFTATTQPSSAAIYTRSGRQVEIVIKITPSVSTTTDATSTITIPTFGGIRLDSVASVVGQNNVNYGNCMVYTNGTIQMPVIGGGFSVPIFIRATLITDHAVA